jgi:cytochrome c-type biogenesis protein CcmE
MRKKWKILVGALVILAALGFLLYRGFQGSAVYYYTMPELRQNAAKLEGSRVRVVGQVSNDTFSWDAVSRTTSFTLGDGQGDSMQVVYRGPVPDAFKAGGDVVVEGKYDVTGPFQADQLIAKCPTRYVPKT